MLSGNSEGGCLEGVGQVTVMCFLVQNIELQVQMEGYKKELAEKDRLLMQAKYVNP